MCRRVRTHLNCVIGQEDIVSYLPLSHIAPQLLDIYTVMVTAGTCWFAQPDALKGSLLQVLVETVSYRRSNALPPSLSSFLSSPPSILPPPSLLPPPDHEGGASHHIPGSP